MYVCKAATAAFGVNKKVQSLGGPGAGLGFMCDRFTQPLYHPRHIIRASFSSSPCLAPSPSLLSTPLDPPCVMEQTLSAAAGEGKDELKRKTSLVARLINGDQVLVSIRAHTYTHTHTHIFVVVVVIIIIIIMTDHCLHPPTSVPSPRCTCACACVCLGARELGNVAIAGSGAPGLRLRATSHCGREDVGSSSHRWPVLRRLWYSATKARARACARACARETHVHTPTRRRQALRFCLFL